jgi:hypothetical protein
MIQMAFEGLYSGMLRRMSGQELRLLTVPGLGHVLPQIDALAGIETGPGHILKAQDVSLFLLRPAERKQDPDLATNPQQAHNLIAGSDRLALEKSIKDLQPGLSGMLGGKPGVRRVDDDMSDFSCPTTTASWSGFSATCRSTLKIPMYPPGRA